MDIQQILDSVSGNLGDVANGEAVMGSPIKLGDTTIIPVSRMSVAFGAGGGEGEGPKMEKGGGEGQGHGAGGGAKIRPVAVIAITPEGINVLPIADRKGKLDAILERIPGFVDEMKKRFEK